MRPLSIRMMVLMIAPFLIFIYGLPTFQIIQGINKCVSIYDEYIYNVYSMPFNVRICSNNTKISTLIKLIVNYFIFFKKIPQLYILIGLNEMLHNLSYLIHKFSNSLTTSLNNNRKFIYFSSSFFPINILLL
jgi:hypothetical protein